MYALPYILLVAIIGIAAVYTQIRQDDEATQRHIWIACIGLLLFFFGCRGFICDDWLSYYPAFELCSSDKLHLNIFQQADNWNYEPGFTLWMLACKTLVNNYFFFQFCCTALNLTLLLLFLRRRVDNIPFALVLFICFGGYGMMTNLMRNSIAILIFANALTYLERRQPLPYFGLCLLALSFHTSALLFFPLYFFLHRKCNRWVYLGIFIAGNAFFLGHVKVFLPLMSLILGDGDGRLQLMVENYTSGELDGATGISIGYLERLLTGVLFFCYYNKLCSIRSNNHIFMNLFIAYFCLFFFLSEFRIVSERLSMLFMMSYWILWADLTHIFHYPNNRKLFIGFMTVYCTLKLIGMTNLVTSAYDNVLFGAKSYQERLYIHNRAPKN